MLVVKGAKRLPNPPAKITADHLFAVLLLILKHLDQYYLHIDYGKPVTSIFKGGAIFSINFFIPNGIA